MTDAQLARITEARTVEGDLTHDALRMLLEQELRNAYVTDEQNGYAWVRDVADAWVVFELGNGGEQQLLQVSYTLDDSNAVTFSGEPAAVVANSTYEPAEPSSSSPAPAPTAAPVQESREQIEGRVLEARGVDATGGRIFRVRVVSSGTSRNGVHYPAHVLEAAAPLYDGARAFDHHRSPAELASSTVQGMVGSYRSPVASPAGIDADLHLLPSATHVAEALDASLAAQAQGLPPLVGISHDVAAFRRPAEVGGRRVQECTAITTVLSADVVADPSAGGRVTRMVAGGLTSTDTTHPMEGPTDMNLAQLLAALREAPDAQARQALLDEHAAIVTASGFTAEQLTALCTVEGSADDQVTPPAPAAPAADDELVGAGQVTEATYLRESLQGGMLIDSAVRRAGLDPERFAPLVRDALGERVSEAQVIGAVAQLGRLAEGLERGGLTATVGAGTSTVQVTAEERDQQVEKLVRTLEGNYRDGYRSLRQAWADVTGASARDLIDGDVPAIILRESFDPGMLEGARVSESVSTSTWAQVLGDSITRRLVAEYTAPGLDAWKVCVSSIVPVSDFRTQRRGRMGGYGTLDAVAEGGAYQDITTVTDEEATYAATKRGGTEDLTLEAIANDDVGAVAMIPRKLGRAAAITLYRFVFDFLSTNATCTYDSVALFHASHGANTATSAALTDATLSTGRQVMRDQAAYGDSVDVLGITPRALLVPNELEALGFRLTRSAVQVPASGSSSDMPNLHTGLELVVVDYWTDANDWILVGAGCPLIELGFYQGRQDPELFVQDDPRQGSTFSADKVTYKVRHIYSGAILDHRGFYRGQG